MKKFVTTSILAAIAAVLLQGTALADSQAKKRKPTFLEQIFGSPTAPRPGSAATCSAD